MSAPITIATLPAPLRATAAAWARNLPATQRERQSIIRALPERGGLSLAAAREACERAADAARAARAARKHRHDGKPHGIPGARSGRLPVRLPKGSPAERLDGIRRATVVGEYRAAYRVPSTGHGDELAVLTTDPAAVGVSQHQGKDWGLYSKSTRYPATVTDTTLTVPADWRRRVQAHGLDLVDGMMCLDAARIEGSPEGVQLWAAVWIEQGRGYSVTARRGVIARQGLTSYHGADISAALAGLRRKIRATEWQATISTAGIDGILGRLSDADLDRMQVRVADARAEGACDYGIRSWCHATGLPYEAGAASLRQVWAAYQSQPRAEARAAILHALRRQRASLAA